MKQVTSLLLGLVFGASAHADFTVVQKVDGLGQQSGNITVKVKDGKARADVAPQISNLIDGETGETITLMHAQKNFIKISAEQTKALMEQMQKLQGATTPSKPVPTGKKENVEQWPAEIFTWSSGNLSARFWVAKGFPKYAELQAALDKVQTAGVATLAKSMMPNSADFQGMVVKTEMKLGQKTITSTIISVTEAPLDAREFVVPPDYKELAAPNLSLPGK